MHHMVDTYFTSHSTKEGPLLSLPNETTDVVQERTCDYRHKWPSTLAIALLRAVRYLTDHGREKQTEAVTDTDVQYIHEVVLHPSLP